MKKYKRLELKPGDRFGMLTYIREAAKKRLPSGQHNRMALVRCDCGNEKEVRVLHLVRERMKSCGCLHPNHGMTKTKLYRVWTGMHVRCYTDTCIDYHRYKGRGIEMCHEWKISFLAFKDWALNNGYKAGLQIDRKDNDKGYSPDNCRFVTRRENMANREVTHMIEYNGEQVSLSFLLHQKGLSDKYNQIRARIKRGWDAQRAVDTPMRKGNYRRRHELQTN